MNKTVSIAFVSLAIISGSIFILTKTQNKEVVSVVPTELAKEKQTQITGVLRTAGLSIEEKQNNNLANVKYQITDLGIDSSKMTANEIQGYFLSSDKLNDQMVGKCITVSGTLMEGMTVLADSYNRGGLLVTKYEQNDYSKCHPYLYSNRDESIPALSFKGVLRRSDRPSPDIGYDYILKLDQPYLDKESASGTAQYVGAIDISPTNDELWMVIENNINKEVAVEGRMLWGYAESRYLEIVKISQTTTSMDNNWRTYKGQTFEFRYPNSWADVTETLLSTRMEVVSEGNLVISDGGYYNQNLGRLKTFSEYTGEVVPKSIQTTKISLGNFNGIKYVEEDNSGRNMVNIILSDKPTSSRLFSIIYMSPVADLAIIDSILNPILDTFKFAR